MDAVSNLRSNIRFSATWLHHGDDILDEAIDDIINFIFQIVFIVASLLGGVLLITEIRFRYQARASGRFKGREPPTLPYALPFLGSYLLNPHKLYRYANNRSPEGRPVKARVGTKGIYVITNTKNARTIFDSTDVLSKNVAEEKLLRASGMGKSDLNIFKKDTSGFDKEAKTGIPEIQRIRRHAHTLGNSHLAKGAAIDAITNEFNDAFIKVLDAEPLAEVKTTGIFEYLKTVMLQASVDSILGTQMRKLNPGFVKAFWAYDEAFPTLSSGAVEKFRDAFSLWLESGFEYFDEKDKNAPWEKNFGSRWIRELVFMFKDAGLSQDGQAIAMLSIIRASVTNNILTTSWIFLESLQRVGLVDRIKQEVTSVGHISSTGKLTLDVPRLLTDCPLLSSMYNECLRTRTSSTITRQVTQNFDLDGYTLKKGNHIIIPSYIPSFSSLFSLPGRPSSTFYPDRFSELQKLAPKNPDEKSQYERATQPDHFFPFGNGAMSCPGKFLAKQEVLSAVVILLLKFEVKAVTWVDLTGTVAFDAAMPVEESAGTGALKPSMDMRVKLTRVK